MDFDIRELTDTTFNSKHVERVRDTNISDVIERLETENQFCQQSYTKTQLNGKVVYTIVGYVSTFVDVGPGDDVEIQLLCVFAATQI